MNRKQQRRMKEIFDLKPGFEWNPMFDYPKHEPCYCGKKLKFKNCCYQTLQPAVPTEVAETGRKYLAYRKQQTRKLHGLE